MLSASSDKLSSSLPVSIRLLRSLLEPVERHSCVSLTLAGRCPCLGDQDASIRCAAGPCLQMLQVASVLQVRKGHLVYDPFAGTGSILIAAAHLGAYTLGSDIDIRVLRDGKTASDGQVHPTSNHLGAAPLPFPMIEPFKRVSRNFELGSQMREHSRLLHMPPLHATRCL